MPLNNDRIILGANRDPIREALHNAMLQMLNNPKTRNRIGQIYEEVKALEPESKFTVQAVGASYMGGFEDALYSVISGEINIKAIRQNL